MEVDFKEKYKDVIGWFYFLVYLCQPRHYVLLKEGDGWYYEFWNTPEGTTYI